METFCNSAGSSSGGTTGFIWPWPVHSGQCFGGSTGATSSTAGELTWNDLPETIRSYAYYEDTTQAPTVPAQFEPDAINPSTGIMRPLAEMIFSSAL